MKKDKSILDERCENCTYFDSEKGWCNKRNEETKKYGGCNEFEESVEYKYKQDHKFGDYILDENLIIKEKPFVFFKKYDFACVGIMLPKEENITDKKGKILSKRQILKPVGIGSDKKIYEIDSLEFENKYKIRINPIPPRFELRWQLESLRKYLDGEIDLINGLELFNKIKNKY